MTTPNTKDLREAIREAQNNEEERREICDDFLDDPYATLAGSPVCAHCGKGFATGERYFRFRGMLDGLCDKCFCDEMEALVYRENGLGFEAHGGGGTILVAVEGEEPLVSDT